jgi:alpha-L-rhamnosidase
LTAGQSATAIDDIRRLFANPPPDSRIMMRWWWFGPAVTKPELERELRAMRDGGIGGVEIQPVYPMTADDLTAGIRNLPFLSDEFLDALRFASRTARDLGMRVDLTLGSGWPYGGPQVSIDRAAAKLRIDRVAVAAGSTRVPVPAIGAGERLIAVFLTAAGGTSRQITEIRDGTVQLDAATAPGTLAFFIASRTGMMVKRAAVGAEGFVLDHLSRPALDAYLSQVGDRLLQAFDGGGPHAVFSDSLEVYEADWSTDFLEEFRRRRGYDLTPHLLDLAATPPADISAAIREDWAQTLSELLAERFLAPMQDWAHTKGTRFRAQDYGTPPATLASNAFADLPEGEGTQWRALSATRWASSASHIFGRPVTSSETWTWLHSPVFRATPLDMKAEADLHFLQGINQLIGHGWPYTAEGVEYPGWRFYAAAVLDDSNPWWIAMPDISRYLQRVSFMLRQGAPANDVAIYVPNHDAWAQMSPGRVNLFQTLRDRIGVDLVGRVLDAGFGVDFFDDELLKRVGKVESGGGLRLGQNVYRIVILPGVERIPPETLRTLDAYVQGGGALVATRRVPAVAPGYRATAADHEAIRVTAQRLFGASGAGELVLREDAQLTERLKSLRAPDVTLAEFRSDIGFIHRHLDAGEAYFVANTSNARRQTAATFRVAGLGAEWWDPLTGVITSVASTATSATSTTIPLALEPYASKILVLSRHTGAPSKPSPLRASATATVDVSTGWIVRFRPGDPPASMQILHSWTDDPATRDFSGVATYSRDVTVPDAMLQPGTVVRLDLGEARPIPPQPMRNGMRAWLDPPVREAAVVYVNDRRAGAIWSAPFSLDVTAYLQRGVNRLRIDVGNLAVNYMAARPLPDYRVLNLRYGVRFEPQDLDQITPVDAGLLGPVRLLAIRR